MVRRYAAVLALGSALMLEVPWSVAASATSITAVASTPRARPAIGSDFNGDGFADLAVRGVPQPRSGAQVVDTLHILFGSPAGLTAAKSQYLVLDGFGTRDVGADSTVALADGDFNGDGYADLAVGLPYAAVGAAAEAGQVYVLFGSSAGLSRTRAQVWHQNRSGVAGRAEPFDRFGAALAAGNFGKGRQDDLAIGVPGEEFQPPSTNSGPEGMVHVLYGSPHGLSAAGSQVWDQDTPGTKGKAEDFDSFGSALAAGHFAGHAYADLAIGVPDEEVSGIPAAGAVNVIYGSWSGLRAAGNQMWTQNSPGIAGTAEQGDLFGSALAAGRFDGRPADDLAISAGGEAVGSSDLYAGAVNVIYGSSGGLTWMDNQLWSQATPGLPGQPEGLELFGDTLATGNFGLDYGGHAYADLAIGVPQESLGKRDAAGAVHVLYGSPSGLTIRSTVMLTQNTPHVPGGAEEGDLFGQALAAADFGHNGQGRHYADLAVGVPNETLGRTPTGALNVLYGGTWGLTGQGGQLWTPRLLGRSVLPGYPLFFGGLGQVVAAR